MQTLWSALAPVNSGLVMRFVFKGSDDRLARPPLKIIIGYRVLLTAYWYNDWVGGLSAIFTTRIRQSDTSHEH